MGPRRQGREHQGRIIRRDSITVPTLWVAVALSLLLHALLLLGWLPKVLTSPIEDPDKGKKGGSLAVRLTPPPKPQPPSNTQPVLTRPPPERSAQKAREAPKAAPKPAPAPQILTAERAAPAAIKPQPAEPPRAQLGGDFAAYVAARRNAREPAPVSSPPPAPAQKETEQERINREAAERLGLTRTPTFGSEKERGGGVFQVQRLGMDDAEFFFYGWNKAIRRNARQMISVRREGNPSIEVAVVRKMISIIREYAKDDFTWESQRLGRDIQLSARLADNAGLEDFMMQEFFSHVRK